MKLRYALSLLIILSIVPTEAWTLSPSDINCSDPYTYCPATCSRTDVESAISSAMAGNGDPANNNEVVIFIPSGDCTWSTAISINGAAERFRVIGNGSGNTIIRTNLFSASGGTANPDEIAHMTLSGFANPIVAADKLRPTNFPNNPMTRVLTWHDLIYTGTAYPIQYFEGWIGVIYNSSFTYTGGSNVYGFTVAGDGTYDNAILGLGSNVPTYSGVAQALYFDNNVFSGYYHTVATFCDAKVVFRYNTVSNSTHCVDVHGPAYNYCGYSGNSNAGGRVIELYNNTFDSTNSCGAHVRSGTVITTANVFEMTGLSGGGGGVYLGAGNDKTCPDGPPDYIHKYVYPCEGGVCQGVFDYWSWGNTCPANDFGLGGDNCFTITNNSCSGGIREGYEYYLRAPQVGDPVESWTPYTYPHPLAGGIDNVPAPFSFTDVTGAAFSTLTTTDPCVTVAGIDAGQTPAISISGTGCQYNVDGGAYTANAGTVGLDNVVCMQGTSSGSYSTVYPSCTLTIGGVTDSDAPWTVTTGPGFAGTIGRGVTLGPGCSVQ